MKPQDQLLIRRATDQAKTSLDSVLTLIESKMNAAQISATNKANTITSATESIMTAAQQIVRQTAEVAFRRPLGWVGGTNDTMPMNQWNKVLQVTPASAKGIRLKIICIEYLNVVNSGDVAADTWHCWNKTVKPSTYVCPDVYTLETLNEPRYKIHPLNFNNGFDLTTGTLEAWCQAFGNCGSSRSLGNIDPYYWWHGPYNPLILIPMNHQLTTRGLQLWSYYTQPLTISYAFFYTTTGEVLENEAV